MELNYYTNQAGQRFPRWEQSLEPPVDRPVRHCTRCGGEIYCGTDTLCDGCLEETGGRRGMVGYMRSCPDDLLEFLEEHQDEAFLDGLFGAFYRQYDISIERWRRS